MQSSRRRFIETALSLCVVVVVLALGACGQTGPTEGSPSTDPGTEPSQATQEKVINVGIYRGFNGLDPAVYEGEPETMATTMMFDRLVCVDRDAKYHPFLAKSWEVSDDGTVWTFHLRDDVVFHDGTPFNAEAVKFHLDRAVDPATKSEFAAALLAPYESSEVVDEFTIKIVLSSPYGPFLDVLSSGYLGIPSPTAVKQWGDDFENHLVGSGPFKFVEWERQTHLILEKNPDYKWGPACAENQGPPHADKLVFKFLPESETREALFDLGKEVNVITAPTSAGLARWQAEPDKFTIVQMVSPGSTYWNTMNVQKPPLDELAVRQAINYAVDRETIVNTLLKGISEPTTSPLAPTTLYFNPDAGKQYTYDPAKAQQLLEDAGWIDSNGDGVREKDGKDLEVEIFQSANMAKDLYKELMCAQLDQVGFRCIVREAEPALRNELGQSGSVHMVPLSVEGLDPKVLSGPLHSRNVDGFNFCKVQDPKLDALLDGADAAVDPEERRALVMEIQDYIMEQAYVLPVHAPYMVWVTRSEVKGLLPDANGWWPYFQDVDIVK